MQTRPFGFTGVPVSAIGQGTWEVEGDAVKERRAVEALEAGIELGMTHIDTAEMYGNGRAEELTGQAIRGRRDRVFLTSKVLPSNASYEGTLRACERSLRRLGVDRLDLYLLHWESNHPIGETMRAMEKLADSGLIRFIGVSNFDVAKVWEVEQALSHHRLAANQVLYHLGDRGIERKLIPYCAERGIAVVAYSPFGSRGGFPKPQSAGGRVLAGIAATLGVTPRQVVLRFLIRNPGMFVIPKASQVEHTRENAASAELRLGAENEAAIDRAFPAPDHDVPLGMI
jgi:diketogulonate reductase-like aldo/keto reductase